MAKRIAVVLSGCGHKDGSEITEAVSALVALSECGVEVHQFAPDIEFGVRDTFTAKPTEEKRNVLHEAARISRGNVKALSELRSADFDGLVFPGGFGVALNLCTWAVEGANCKVEPETERVIREFYKEEKPIAAICIAPALVARVLGSEGITVTLGAEAGDVEKTGATHETCAVDDFITDRDHRIVTTPAYMYDGAKPFEVFTGIRKAIRELVEMA